ncbi:MAG TPA: DUF2474 domain-containing protein [Burkholderiaceae bacterium]|nr:DUF2474 domain-containing protein [Burkholderiaceae bacterium]
MHGDDATPRGRLWLRRIGWLVVFWALGVVAVGMTAYVLKFFMRMAGLST